MCLSSTLWRVSLLRQLSQVNHSLQRRSPDQHAFVLRARSLWCSASVADVCRTSCIPQHEIEGAWSFRLLRHPICPLPGGQYFSRQECSTELDRRSHFGSRYSGVGGADLPLDVYEDLIIRKAIYVRFALPELLCRARVHTRRSR